MYDVSKEVVAVRDVLEKKNTGGYGPEDYMSKKDYDHLKEKEPLVMSDIPAVMEGVMGKKSTVWKVDMDMLSSDSEDQF